MALSHGSSTWGVSADMMTGLFIDGFRARKSASSTCASRATMATSMSRSMGTESKNGWLPMPGRVLPKRAGLATMFLTACSLGT